MKVGLRTELLLVIVLGAALPLAGFATFAHLESRRALKDALLDQQSKVANERADALSREISTLQRAMAPLLSGALSKDSSPGQVQATLTELFLRRDAVSQVALVAPDGRVLASLFVDDPQAFARSRPEFAKHPVVTANDIDALAAAAKTGAPAAPGGAADALILTSDPSANGSRLSIELRLGQLLRGALGIDDDGEVVLVKDNGVVVAGERGVGEQRQELSTGAAARADRLTWEHRAHLAARAQIRGTPFSVAVLRDEALALAPLSRLAFVTFGLLLFTLFTAVAVGATLSRHLSRPIARLADGARELARGNLKHRLPGHRVPELEEVARAFNQMAEALDAANTRLVGFNEELQKQVAERTRELREAQAQLLRSQRLGAVIDLTAGLAHELNNPLAAIIGTAQLLQIELPANDPLQERIDPIVSEGLRISKLLKRITSLSEGQSGKLTPSDLNALIDRALADAKPQFEQTRAEISRQLDPSLPRVLADPPALTDVVGRLLDNASRALAGRPARQIRVVTRALEGQAVRIEIQDTGRGIPRENLERIFNPFFATEAGKQAGMSLARCHQVVEAHGGKLTVQSEEGVGTTVAVVLPAAPPRAQLL